jgi:hypothetical protein
MRVIMLSVLAIAASGAAAAQGTTLDRVYACTSITKTDDRLACFDAAVADFKQAQTTGDVQVVTREQAVQAEKQAFGLRAPEAVVAAKTTAGVAPPAPEVIETVKVQLTAAVKRGDGKYRFTMSDGQVWEQIDTDTVSGVRKLPLPAEIKTAALGSFMMKIDGGRAIRVRRVK